LIIHKRERERERERTKNHFESFYWIYPNILEKRINSYTILQSIRREFRDLNARPRRKKWNDRSEKRMCAAWGLKKWLRAIRSFHPVVTIMLSFTLEGDRWRVAGTFDTGTLQQEFDRPSCKRSSLLLYLFFLFLTISFFRSFSVSVSISFLFALCVTRPFARSQLSFNPYAFTRFLFYRSSLSSLFPFANSSHPLLLLSFIKYVIREQSMSRICKIHFVKWILEIANLPRSETFSHPSPDLFFFSLLSLCCELSVLSIYVYFPLSTLYCSTIG